MITIFTLVLQSVEVCFLAILKVAVVIPVHSFHCTTHEIEDAQKLSGYYIYTVYMSKQQHNYDQKRLTRLAPLQNKLLLQ